MLRCSDEIDGTRYLEADYREECNTTAHTIHAIVAMAVMLVFSLGFPLSAGVVLWRRHRHGRLHDEDTRKQFLFLSEGAIACCVVCRGVCVRLCVCLCVCGFPGAAQALRSEMVACLSRLCTFFRVLTPVHVSLCVCAPCIHTDVSSFIRALFMLVCVV